MDILKTQNAHLNNNRSQVRTLAASLSHIRPSWAKRSAFQKTLALVRMSFDPNSKTGTIIFLKKSPYNLRSRLWRWPYRRLNIHIKLKRKCHLGCSSAVLDGRRCLSKMHTCSSKNISDFKKMMSRPKTWRILLK